MDSHAHDTVRPANHFRPVPPFGKFRSLGQLDHSSRIRIEKLPLGQGDEPENPCLNQFPGFPMSRMMQLEPHPQFDTILPADTHHLQGIFYIQGHRFLYQDMFARFRGHLGIGGMQEIRRGDIHRVNPGVAEKVRQKIIGRLEITYDTS